MPFIVPLAVIAVIGSVQWFVRPVMFSFLLFSLVYWWALAWKERGVRIFYFSPIFFALWANLHPGFVIAGAVFAALFVSEFFEAEAEQKFKRLAMVLRVALLSAAATVLNPYGLALHKSIFALVGNDYFMSLNQEWHPPRLADSLFLPFFVLAAVVILGAALLRKYVRFSIFEWILLIVFFTLSLLQRRYIPFFAIVAAGPLFHIFYVVGSFLGQRFNFKLFGALDDWESSCHKFLYSKALVIALVICVVGLKRLPYRMPVDFPASYPAKAIEYLRSVGARGRIFHTPDWGGYLTWHLWPKQQAYIDDRNLLNGEVKYREFFVIYRAEAAWKRMLNERGFDWLLLEPEAPIAKAMEKEPFWRLVSEGPQYRLYQRALFTG